MFLTAFILLYSSLFLKTNQQTNTKAIITISDSLYLTKKVTHFTHCDYGRGVAPERCTTK